MPDRTMLTRALAAATALALLVLPSVAAATTTVVGPSALGVWQISNFDNATALAGTGVTTSGTRGQFVVGPAAPPLGVGSFRQKVGTDGDDAQRLRTSTYNGAPIASLDIDYSTYVTQNNGGQATYVQLFVDTSGDGAFDDILFFEPVYQTGLYGGDPVPDQCPAIPNCVAIGAWQTWDATGGGWWPLNAGTFGPPLVTLASYEAAHPGTTLATGTTALRLTAGFGGAAWQGYDGTFDAVSINGTTFDMEPVGAVVVVTPSALGVWQILNFDAASSTNTAGPTSSGTRGQFATGPGAPPRGTGSFRQRVGTNGDDGTRLRTAALNGTALGDLDIHYSTYVTQNNGGQATYVQLFVDTSGDGAFDDILFFEPVYQTGLYGGDPVPDQCPAIPNCVAIGAWQTWDATGGGWWSLNAGTFGPPLVTLASYLSANPGARLATSTPALRLTSGFGAGAWDNFDGNVDSLIANGTLYDFENGPAVPPNHPFAKLQSPAPYQVITGTNSVNVRWKEDLTGEPVLGYVVLIGRPFDPNARARRVIKGDPGDPCNSLTGICSLSITFPFGGLPADGKYAIGVITLFADGHRSDGRCDDGSPFGTPAGCDAVVTHPPGYDRPWGNVPLSTAPIPAYEFLIRARAWPRVYQEPSLHNVLLVDPGAAAGTNYELIGWRVGQLESLFTGRATITPLVAGQALLTHVTGSFTAAGLFDEASATAAAARIEVPPAYVLLLAERI